MALALPEADKKTVDVSKLSVSDAFKSTGTDEFGESELGEVAASRLALHVATVWETNKKARLHVEQKLIALRRRLAGEYSPTKLAALRLAGMPEDFFQLTARKARDVEGWVWEVFNSTQERTWDIVPDNFPEIPTEERQAIENHVRETAIDHPDVQQLFQVAQQTGVPVNEGAVRAVIKKLTLELKDQVESEARHFAEERCTSLEKKMQDILLSSGYYEALRQVNKDISELKIGIMKGPILRKERIISGWDENRMATVSEETVYKFYRVSPFDWFPAPGSKHVQDGACIELEHYKASDLQKMIGVSGYDEAALRKIIRQHSTGYTELTTTSAERHRIEQQDPAGYTDACSQTIDSLDFWGNIPGYLLTEYGVKDIKDPEKSYPCNVKMVGGDVWRAVLNPDPLGENLYHVTSFDKSNDSQWGTAPAELGAGLEDFCNNAIRNLVWNMGESAGPMAEVNIDRLAPGETAERWPHKTFLSTSKTMTEAPAVRYYQANLLGAELWNLYEKAKAELDVLVVPSFSSGLAKGAGRTASGLAMIQNADSRNLKVVVANVDKDINLSAVNRIFRAIMMFDPDPSVKGGLKFQARGIGAQLLKQGNSVRRQEFIKSIQTPTLAPLFGNRGFGYMLKDEVKELGWEPSEAMPGYEQLERQKPEPIPPVAPEQQVAAGAQAAMMPGAVKTDVSGTPMKDYHQ